MPTDANTVTTTTSDVSGPSDAVTYLQTYYSKATLEAAVKSYPVYVPQPGDLFMTLGYRAQTPMGPFFCVSHDSQGAVCAYEVGEIPDPVEPDWAFHPDFFTFTKVTL